MEAHVCKTCGKELVPQTLRVVPVTEYVSGWSCPDRKSEAHPDVTEVVFDAPLLCSSVFKFVTVEGD